MWVYTPYLNIMNGKELGEINYPEFREKKNKGKDPSV